MSSSAARSVVAAAQTTFYAQTHLASSVAPGRAPPLTPSSYVTMKEREYKHSEILNGQAHATANIQTCMLLVVALGTMVTVVAMTYIITAPAAHRL